MEVYPLVNIQKTMERSTIWNVENPRSPAPGRVTGARRVPSSARCIGQNESAGFTGRWWATQEQIGPWRCTHGDVPKVCQLVGGLEHVFIFHFIYGMWSFPLMNSIIFQDFIFFKMVIAPPTSESMSKLGLKLQKCRSDHDKKVGLNHQTWMSYMGWPTNSANRETNVNVQTDMSVLMENWDKHRSVF